MSKDWIDECFRKKAHVPEAGYAFARKPAAGMRRLDSLGDDEGEEEDVPRPLQKKSKPAAKKKKAAGGGSEDESDGPNEYDLNDSFLAKEDDYATYLRKQAHDSDASGSGSESSDEDVGELVQEARSFIRDTDRWERRLKQERAAERQRMQELEDEEAATRAKRARPTSPTRSKAAALESIVAMRSKQGEKGNYTPAPAPAYTRERSPSPAQATKQGADDTAEHSDGTEELDPAELAARQLLLRTDTEPLADLTRAPTEEELAAAPLPPPCPLLQQDDSVDLPEFFAGMRFWIYPDGIDDKLRRTLVRFITAYGGYMRILLPPFLTAFIYKSFFSSNFYSRFFAFAQHLTRQH